LEVSPDGNRLALSGEISTEPERLFDIFTIDLNGSNLINLTNGFGDNFDPVWSPVGDWIAFHSGRSGTYEIYLIKPYFTIMIHVRMC
jgi:TolB protein